MVFLYETVPESALYADRGNIYLRCQTAGPRVVNKVVGKAAARMRQPRHWRGDKDEPFPYPAEPPILWEDSYQIRRPVGQSAGRPESPFPQGFQPHSWLLQKHPRDNTKHGTKQNAKGVARHNGLDKEHYFQYSPESHLCPRGRNVRWVCPPCVCPRPPRSLHLSDRRKTRRIDQPRIWGNHLRHRGRGSTSGGGMDPPQGPVGLKLRPNRPTEEVPPRHAYLQTASGTFLLDVIPNQ